MKNKLLITAISIVLILSMVSCQSVDIPIDTNYVKGYSADTETKEIINMLGNNSIFIFEYDANDHTFISVDLQRYEYGQRIDDLNICSMGGGEDATIINGKITITIDEQNQLRLAVTSDDGAAMMNTQYMDIGAPTEESGSLTSSLVDKYTIEENSEIPLLFIGYTGDDISDIGYLDGLHGIDEDDAAEYTFCYRVVARFTKSAPY